MILSAQKRDYETELDQNAAIFGGEIADLNYEYKKLSGKYNNLNHENFELRAKLEIQELKVMRSCRNWSKIPQLKCAVNPSGSCLECRDYEVLGK
jgi:hypothetical protein